MSTVPHLPASVETCHWGAFDAAQGDGEVCTTAIETALLGTFELVLHQGQDTGSRWAWTPTSTSAWRWRCAT